MQLSLLTGSLLLFGLSVLLWFLLTLFESALVGISLTAERVITFLLLVLPAGLGALVGLISLLRQEGRTWLALTGIALNILFAIFQLIVIFFAG